MGAKFSVSRQMTVKFQQQNHNIKVAMWCLVRSHHRVCLPGRSQDSAFVYLEGMYQE